MPRKGDVRTGGTVANPLRLRCAKDDLNIGRMARDPGGCNAGRRYPIRGRQRFEHIVQFSMALTVAKECTVEEAPLVWRPGLQHHALQSRVVQQADVPRYRLVETVHVHSDTLGEKVGVGDAELDLIETGDRAALDTLPVVKRAGALTWGG